MEYSYAYDLLPVFHLDDEKVKEAKALLAQLERRFTDRLPEITRARTLLSFYEV